MPHVTKVILAIGLAFAPVACVRAEDHPLPDATRLEIETVPIQGAEFTMGTPLEKGQAGYHEDEAPLQVTVDSFRIGKYPVTAAQMCAFLNSEEARKSEPQSLYNHRDLGKYKYSTIELTDDGRYRPRKEASHAPANQVTWKGAVLFCAWLSATNEARYRLPSEAEWELAARGKQGREWPWGSEVPTEIYGERYGGETGVPVGSHPVNATPEGVHDLLAYIIGEWCANKYFANPTPAQATETRLDSDDLTTLRVVRGDFQRSYPRGGRLLQLTTYGWKSHFGRPWTRAGCHPMTAPQTAARFGFRVVEVTQTEEPTKN